MARTPIGNDGHHANGSPADSSPPACVNAPARHISKENLVDLASEIRAGRTTYTRVWASNIYKQQQAIPVYDAFVFDAVTGQQTESCKVAININAHISYLEIFKEDLGLSARNARVTIKINPQSLRSIRAADASPEHATTLPTEISQWLRDNTTTEMRQRVSSIQCEGSSEASSPTLLIMEYESSLAAQEHLAVGNPVWAHNFKSLILQNRLCIIVAGNSQVIKHLYMLWEVCAFQLTLPLHVKWRSFTDGSSDLIPKLVQQPVSVASTQDYRYTAKAGFHGLNEYAIVMQVGASLDHAYRSRELELYTAGSHDLQMVEIAETSPPAYFGFIDRPKNDLRLNPRTKISLGFGDSDKPQYTWSATVTEAIPYGPQDTLPLLLVQSIEKKKKPLPLLSTAPDSDILRVHLSTQNVSVEVTESDKTFDQNTEALGRLLIRAGSTFTNVGTPWDFRAVKLLSGQNLDALMPTDLFEHIRRQFPSPEHLMNINDVQRQAVQAARTSHGGFQFIQGPPGTGKTHYATEVAGVFFRAREVNMLVVVSQANRSVTTLAISLDKKMRILQAAGKTEKSRYIVRVHSRGTEMQICHTINPENLSTAPGSNSVQDPLKAYLRQCYLKHTETKYRGISDRRVQELHLSVGWRMLQLSGVIPHPYLTCRDGKWGRFRQLWHQVVARKPETASMEREFREECHELYCYTLQHASAVVATVDNIASKGVIAAIKDKVSLIILDEAGREREDNILPILAADFPRVIGMITIGDPQQLKPQIECPIEINPFAEQLELSFLERMARIGFPLHTFTRQYRMVPDISAVPNQLTYNNQLQDDDSVQLVNRPLARTFRELVFEISGRESSLLFMNALSSAVNATKTDSSHSRYNELMIIEIVNWLPSLLASLKEATFGILTAYTAQSSRLEHAISGMKHTGVSGAERVHVGRFDGEQGEEYDIVIIDLLVGNTVGFLSDERRLNVAMSRARNGLIVFADAECVEGSQGEAPYLHALMEILQRGSVVRRRHHDFPDCQYYQPESQIHSLSLTSLSLD